MTYPYILETLRMPVGKRGGSLSRVHPATRTARRPAERV